MSKIVVFVVLAYKCTFINIKTYLSVTIRMQTLCDMKLDCKDNSSKFAATQFQQYNIILSLLAGSCRQSNGDKILIHTIRKLTIMFGPQRWAPQKC